MPDFVYGIAGVGAADNGGAGGQGTDLDTGRLDNAGAGGIGSADDITIAAPDNNGDGNNY